MQTIKKTSKILKWGNSLGIRLTNDIVSLTPFELNSEVDIIVSNGEIIIKKKSKLTENLLLEGLDSYNAHADELIAISNNEILY